jgi:DNA helicase-2/ATP-dependent DNA helicase PcrA
MPNQPADCRDAVHWFIDNVGLYLGSVRGLFACDFSDEQEALLEAAIISLRTRGVTPFVITGEALYKQAEHLWPQAVQGTSFGRPMASQVELDVTGAQVLVLKDLEAPENAHHLWYLYHQVIYPRALSGKPTVITSQLGQKEFANYGAACDDIEYAGRKVTWEKLMWALDATCIDLPHFKLMKEEGLAPMLKPEYYLYKALKEQDINVHPHHVVGDFMLDFAVTQRDRKLDIEIDVLSSLDAVSAHSWEAKRNLLLLNDGWNILRFTTAEILSNLSGCVEAVVEVWQQGRKKQTVGRLLSGQAKTTVPELPVDDDTQRFAIMNGGGPVAIEGGAGTGKSSCVTHRVAYLLAQGVTPEKILVISHSQETIRALRSSAELIADKQLVQRVSFYGWNDLGMKILKENLSAIKRKPPLKLEANPQRVIQRLLSRHKKELDPVMLEISEELDEFTLASLIALYKANLISPKFLKEKAQSDLDTMVAKVYQGYEEQLQKSNRIDRDDMVGLAALVLVDHAEIRARYQYQFDFVIVDEYQDATAAGDLLARLLALPQDNLYLAGNEDEAIYESKGGLPRLMSEISIRLPNTRCFVLDKNWRSHPAIVEHSKSLISGLTRRRIKKDMVSGWGAPTTSAIVGPQVLESEAAEADWVADETLILIDSGRGPQDIAVLYRYHRYGIIIEEALSRRGVRCVTSHPEAGLIPDEVGDVMAFLKLVMDPDGPKARESFERVCQLRVKEVDPKLSATIASFAEANNLSYLKAVEIYSEAVAEQSCRDLEQLVRIIRTMNQENLPPAETISLLKRTQRLSEFYKSVKVPPGVNYEPLRKLGQLEEEARKYKTVSEFVKSHSATGKPQDGKSEDKVVHILTLHEAKGREFPVIFLVGLAEGLFPAESNNDREEERRLCYVGMTRARELLYLSYPSMFNNVALQPSSFLLDARLLARPQSMDVEPAPSPPQEVAPPVMPEPAKPVIKKVAAVSVQGPVASPASKPQTAAPQQTAPANPPATGQYPSQPGVGQVPGQHPLQPGAGQYPRQSGTGQYPNQPGGAKPAQPAAQQSGTGQYPPQPGTGQYPVQGGTGQYPNQPGGVKPAQPAAPQAGTGQYPPQPGTGQFPVQGGAGQYPNQPGGVKPAQPAAQQAGTGQYPPQPGTGQFPVQGGAGQFPNQPGGVKPAQPAAPQAWTGQYPPQPVTGQYPVQGGAGQYPNQPGGVKPAQPAAPQSGTGQYPSQPVTGQYPVEGGTGQYPNQPGGVKPAQPAAPQSGTGQFPSQSGTGQYPQHGVPAKTVEPNVVQQPQGGQEQPKGLYPTQQTGQSGQYPTQSARAPLPSFPPDAGAKRPPDPNTPAAASPPQPGSRLQFVPPKEVASQEAPAASARADVPALNSDSDEVISAYSKKIFRHSEPSEDDLSKKLEELPSWPPPEGQLTASTDPPAGMVPAELEKEDVAPPPVTSLRPGRSPTGPSGKQVPPPLEKGSADVDTAPPPMSASEVAEALRSGRDDLVSGAQSLAPALDHSDSPVPKKGKGRRQRAAAQEQERLEQERLEQERKNQEELEQRPHAAIPQPDEPEIEHAPRADEEIVPQAAVAMPPADDSTRHSSDIVAPGDEPDVPAKQAQKSKRSVPSDAFWSSKKSSEGTAIGDVWSNPDAVKSTLHEEIQAPPETIAPQSVSAPPPQRGHAVHPVAFEDDPEAYLAQNQPANAPPGAPYPVGEGQPPAQPDSRGFDAYSQAYSEHPAYPEFPPDQHAPEEIPEHLPICPGCGTALEAGSRFCGECGFRLEERIPACHLCGAPLDPAAKFCGECGAKRMGVQPNAAAQMQGSEAEMEKFKQYIDQGGRPTQHGWLVKFLKKLEQ